MSDQTVRSLFHLVNSRRVSREGFARTMEQASASERPRWNTSIAVFDEGYRTQLGAIDELPSLLRANKPGSLQLLHVVRERSRTDIHTIPHIATRGRTRLRTQLLQNFVPPRVSQRTSNQVDLVLGKLDLLGSRHWHWMSFGLERLLAVPARTRGLGFSLLVSCHSHGEKPP